MNITKKNRELLAKYLEMSLTNSPITEDLTGNEDFLSSASQILEILYDTASVSEEFVQDTLKSGIKNDTVSDLPYVIEHPSPSEEDLKVAKFLLEGAVFLDIGVRLKMAHDIDHAIQQRGMPVFESQIAGSVVRQYTIHNDGVEVSAHNTSKVAGI